MRYTTTSEGRACDALSNGPVNGSTVVVDGIKSPLFPGEVVKFWTGDIAKIVSVEGPVLRLDREISAPDNCGIWKA